VSDISEVKEDILNRIQELVGRNPITKENAREWRELTKDVSLVLRALDFLARDIIYPT